MRATPSNRFLAQTKTAPAGAVFLSSLNKQQEVSWLDGLRLPILSPRIAPSRLPFTGKRYNGPRAPLSLMIRSFTCPDTKALFAGQRVPRFANIASVAERKLAMLNAATELRDLRSPPGNKLESLAGKRAGQHSIRINSQWRICFVWTNDGPGNVEIVDYH